MGRDGHGLVESDPAVAQRLERQVKGHHLGQAGRMAQFIGVHRRQHIAARGLDDDRTVAARPDLSLRGPREQAGRDDQQGQADPCGSGTNWHHMVAKFMPEVGHPASLQARRLQPYKQRLNPVQTESSVKGCVLNGLFRVAQNGRHLWSRS
ncbi:protein of unknown function [Rhodovastum atsumiense]|nr:protein of unknown function [Rhodovastum atsumiense]